MSKLKETSFVQSAIEAERGGLKDLGKALLALRKASILTTITDLDDVETTELQPGQILKWNGSTWVNGTAVAGEGDFQPLDPTLTAIAALDPTAGVLYQTGADTFEKRVLGTAGGTIAAGDHTHDDRYTLIGHTHAAYSLTTHNHNGTYAPAVHDHDALYSPLSHNHDLYYISVVSTPTEGNFPVITATGELNNSTYNSSSFALSLQTINTTHSLTGGGDLSDNRTLSLVGDVASPGTSMVYGTDVSGNRGWKPDPAGGEGGGLLEATSTQVRAGTSGVAVSPASLFSAHAPVVLTDGATVSVDMSLGLVFKLTLGGNRTIVNPTNVKVGQSGEFWIIQDATGSRTLTWGSDYIFVGGAPTLPTAANAVCVVAYRVLASGEIRCSANTGIAPSGGEPGEHDHDTDYISIVATPTAGNFPVLTAGGELDNSTYSSSSFASGAHDHDSVYIPVVGTPTIGNFVQLIAGGELEDAGVSAASFATAAQGALADSATQPADNISTLTNDSAFLAAATTANVRSGAAGVAVTPSVLFSSQEAVTLTDGATVNVDMNTGLVFKLTLGGNRTIVNPTNAKLGQSGEFWIYQDATGSRTLDWDTEYTFLGGEPELDPTPNSVALVAYRVLATGQIVCIANTGLGYDNEYISIITTPTIGNFPVISSGGELSNSTYSNASFATAAQGTLADSATQPGDNISTLTNDSAFIASTRSVLTTHSLTGGGDLTADRTLALLNDTATPGSNKVYGTDAAGARGWKDDPSGGAGSSTFTGLTDTPANYTSAGGMFVKVNSGATALEFVAQDAELTALAGLTSAADTLPYFTGSGTAGVTPLSAFGRSLIDDAADTNARTTLGLGTVATLSSVSLTTNVTDTLPIGSGGTGQTTAAAAFTALKQVATETSTGVVELATSAETTAGLVVQASDTRLSDARTPTAHDHDSSYISIVATPTTGNFPVLTAGGELNNSTYSNASFATAAQGALADTALQDADVGTIAAQDANNVTITGGSISGITDLAIADGGTGASTAAAAFTALKQAASETETGVVELATNAEVAAGTDTTRAITPAGAAATYALIGAGGGLSEATSTELRSGTAGVAISPSVLYAGMAPVTLTDGATVSVDMNAGIVFKLTLGGNRAMANPTNAKIGQTGEFWILQDATGGRTLSWGTDYVFVGGTPVQPTAANAVCVVAYRVLASGEIRCSANTGVAPTGGAYTDEEAQDAVGTILADSDSINFTYTDATPEITAVAIFGTTATTVCVGNDARLSDARTPTSHDHSADKLAQANTHESPDTDVGPTSLHHTLGTGANQAAAGNHNHDAAYQPLDSELTAIAGLTSAANALPYFTGSGTAGVTTLTAYGRSLIDDADAATAQGTLGLGTIATQASSNVTITGGSITGITDLAIADGGTGASTAANAFTALKQSATDTATGVVELATDAEVATGTDTTRAVTPAGAASRYQVLDAELTAIAGLTSAANALPYFTGSGTASVTTLTAFGRSLIDDAADSNARTTLGLGTIATQSAASVAITGGSVTGITDLAIADGGTGASTAADAFTALKQAATTTATGVVELATDGENAANVVVQGNDSRLHAAVTLAGAPTYLTLSNQQITRALIDLTSHVTGALPIANLANLATATETGTSRTNTAADRGNFVRWTSTAAKTFTIANSVAAAGDVWQGFAAGATGNLTLAQGAGVTLTGNLIFAPGKAYTLRFTAASAADVIGGSAT